METIKSTSASGKRFHDIDFARAVPLLMLPYIHCYEQLEAAGVLTADVVQSGRIFLTLCILCPSVFMMALGMNLTFSSHTSARELTRRGIRTIVYFFLLNIVRTGVPAVVFGLLYNNFEELPDVPIYLVQSDILFFAGAAFLFFALMKRREVKTYYILIIAIFMLTLDAVIPDGSIEDPFWSYLAGNLFYVNDASCFPVLSWMIFPAVGYAMGKVLIRMPSEEALDAFYKKMILGGAAVLLCTAACLKSYGLDPLLIATSPANDYITDLFNIVLNLAVAGIWFGCIHFLCKCISSPRVKRAIDIVSRAILIFYVIQWILVGWLEYWIACSGFERQFGAVSFAGISIAVFAVSLAIAGAIQKRKTVKKGRP